MPQNQDIHLRSEQVQEVLTAIPHWLIRWGNVLFFVLIFMLLFISWFIKYPDIITSESMITTQIPPQKEYANISGRLDTILVGDSDTVTKNQPLAIIENTANFEDVLKLKAIIDTININNDFFDFPIDDIPTLSLGDIESPYAIFENNYIQYQLNKKLQPFLNEASANQYALSEQKRRLKNLYAQETIGEKELSFKRKDLERSKLLFEQGVIAEKEYETKQLAYAQAELNHQNFTSSISQLKEVISNANKTAKGIEINRIKEELVLLKNTIQSFNQLKKAFKEWERTYVLKSNIEGVVAFLSIWSANQNVNQGELVFTIVPIQNSSFIAKLKTPSQNSGKIQVGQKVNIKLENYPDAEFGVLNGVIKKISLTPDKEGNYFVDVKLSKNLITSYNKEIAFKQEMRGMAEIITEDLRLIERFFYQFKGMFQK